MAKPTERFLVIRLSSIGDIVHALPAVSALGATFPHAEITWAIEARHAALVEGNPYVRRVLKFDTLAWRNKLNSASTLEEIARGLLALRESAFDASIDFQGLLKSALIGRLSGSRERVGFAENWLREPAAGVFYTERVVPRERKHVIEMNLALVERLGVPPRERSRWEFPLPQSEADDRHVQQQLASLGAIEFVVINPGGGWKSKCWPPENFAQLIRRLETELPWQVLLTGSPEEEGLIRSILDQAGARRAIYFPSTVVEVVALARRARLFVGGDTGPVHLAAALGTPVVAIFGAHDPLNTPERNGPFSPDDITVSNQGLRDDTRSWKNAGYLPGISVDAVLAAVRERRARAYG